MTGEVIAGLLIKFGPIAFEWIKSLAKIWSKTMTPDDLDALINGFSKDYESYIANAGGRPLNITINQ